MKERERVIKNYMEAYNQCNVEKMIKDFDENIFFENIEGEQSTMQLTGIPQFKLQAEKVLTYFAERKQTITSMAHSENKTEVEIEYFAIVGMDLPNGLQKGQELNLVGKSVFEFSGNKITKLQDIS